MTTDTSERGLERLICTALTGHPCDRDVVSEAVAGYGRAATTAVRAGGGGWVCGDPNDYDREYCVDLVQFSAFLRETQPAVAEVLALEEDGPTRRKFLARLQGESGPGLQECPEELRQAERPYRARQRPGARDDGRDAGRYRAVQAVHGQRGVQSLDDRHRVRAYVRGPRDGRSDEPRNLTVACGPRRLSAER